MKLSVPHIDKRYLAAPILAAGWIIAMWSILGYLEKLLGRLPLIAKISLAPGISFAIAIIVGIIPAYLFARFTIKKTHLHLRAAMHAVVYAVCLFYVLPSAVLILTGGPRWYLRLPSGILGNLILQVLALPGLLGLAAIQEFYISGKGSPMPWDAPTYLVTGGPYAYIANPMQLTKAIYYGIWVMATGNVGLLLLWVISTTYSIFIAAPKEHKVLSKRFGDEWHTYRHHLRSWLPRWRPWYDPTKNPAILYLDLDCAQCAQLANWFACQRSPKSRTSTIASDQLGNAASRNQVANASLDLRHISTLLPTAIGQSPHANLSTQHRKQQITYQSSNGTHTTGVIALANACNHLNFIWALTSWAIRLPVVSFFLQQCLNVSTLSESSKSEKKWRSLSR